MRRPQLDLPRSLFYGSTIVMLVYVAANLGYYRMLSATTAISLLILVSILGSMNGMILTGPRVSYAMARQGVFPRVFGHTNDRHWHSDRCLDGPGRLGRFAGRFRQLRTTFYRRHFHCMHLLRTGGWGGLGAAAHWARIEATLLRPGISVAFRTVLRCGNGLDTSTLIERPRDASIGIGLVASGLPLYFFCTKASSERQQNDRPCEPGRPPAKGSATE